MAMYIIFCGGDFDTEPPSETQRHVFEAADDDEAKKRLMQWGANTDEVYDWIELDCMEADGLRRVLPELPDEVE